MGRNLNTEERGNTKNIKCWTIFEISQLKYPNILKNVAQISSTKISA